MPSSNAQPDVVTIDCLRQVVDGESRSFPLLVGFATAKDLVRIASAPSFRSTAPHRQIAARVLEPPVSDWQRPLDTLRVGSIARVFNDLENLMPNPVLLSANVDTAAISPRPVVGANGVPTGIFQVAVEVPESGGETPLWILDGQHRINGLAQSAQRDRMIPVVMLLEAGADRSYNGRDFANIFAQVTVTAKSLDPIHQEWLTYCYELENYSEDWPDYELHRDAFETVATLCHEATLGDPAEPNPWFNTIIFNPEPDAPGVKRPGFNYTCTELKALLLRHYWKPASALGQLLEPDELAVELARALTALERVVSEPQDETVFLGRQAFGHKVMQDAFLSGVCARLVAKEPPDSWTDLLRNLRFDATNWNFSWASTRGGNAGNVSRKLAESILSRAMRDGALPATAGNLSDFLRGNRAQVVVLCSYMTPSGRPSKTDVMEITVVRGDDVSQSIGGRRHVRVLQPGRRGIQSVTSENVGKIVVAEASSPGRATQIAGATGVGFDLADWGQGSVSLGIGLEHYGDGKSNATLELSWT